MIAFSRSQARFMTAMFLIGFGVSAIASLAVAAGAVFLLARGIMSLF